MILGLVRTAALYGLSAFGLVAWSVGPVEATDVLTYHNDANRTGWNQTETILTPSALRSGGFSQSASVTVDNQIDAQPLFVSNVTMGDRIRDVVYLATEGDTIYAIDANSGAVLLQRNLGTPVAAGKGKPIDCGNNATEIGITSTPVIDRASETLYLVAFLWEGNTAVYRLFALDLRTLADKKASQVIRTSLKLEDGDTFTLNPLVSRQRPALTLAGGQIYVAFGSFCDHNADQSRGLVLSFAADSLLASTPGEAMDRRSARRSAYHLSSIWMSGAGPAADPTGDIFFITGNSRVDTPAPAAGVNEPMPYMAESVIRTTGDLTKITDFFKPFNYRLLDLTDKDFGSGGLILVPEKAGDTIKLLVAAGKDGRMFLLDRDNLGKLSAAPKDNVLNFVDIGKCWCTQSYYVGSDGVGRVISSGGAMLSSWIVSMKPQPKFAKEWDGQSTLGSDVFQKGFFTSISSNGVQPDTAIVWAVQRPTALPAVLTLWAVDAKTGTPILALPAGKWPNVGGSANTVPVVANGHVFVASFKEMKIFGIARREASASIATANEHAASVQDEKAVVGRILSMNGNVLKLKTNQAEMDVDVGDAVAQNKSVTLEIGAAIKVFGSQSQAQGPKVLADSIEYAPENPALWKADPVN